jgi:hypothetical protein
MPKISGATVQLPKQPGACDNGDPDLSLANSSITK